MKKVLYILGEFDDADVDWLLKAGRHLDVAPGQAIISEGEPIPSFFFVTAGIFKVVASHTEVARLGTGEVVGEISFVDDRPPTATVTAVEESQVLAIPREALAQKLEESDAFAGRFYKAVSTFLADRLRRTLLQLKGGDEVTADELDLDELHTVTRAGARFERILRRLQDV